MAPNNLKPPVPMKWEDLVAPCGKYQHNTSEESSKKEENKTADSIDSDIPHGTYSASVFPLLALVFGFLCGDYAFTGYYRDPRVKGWFLVDNRYGVIIISVIYILFSMTWGPRLMKGRKPMQLKKVMIAYNAFQVCASAYMFIETGIVGWFFDYNYRCQPCNYSNEDKAIRMTHIVHWYFLSKILDFVDTALFILRGKLSQVTYLHVIHHSCMFMSMWHGLHHTPGGHITFMGFLNTFVHTVMYSYYLLAAMGPRVRPYLWWKKYLTKLQLTQFVLIFLHTAQLLVFPCEGVPTSLIIWTLLYSFLFFALFINFYIKAYLFRSRLSASKKAEAAKDSIKEEASSIQSNGFTSASTTQQNFTREDRNGNITKFVEKTKFRVCSGSAVAL